MPGASRRARSPASIGVRSVRKRGVRSVPAAVATAIASVAIGRVVIIAIALTVGYRAAPIAARLRCATAQARPQQAEPQAGGESEHDQRGDG